jgi:hypothetical protein
MKRASRLIAALVVTHVLLHVVALSVELRRPQLLGEPRDLILYVLFMLGPSQGTLLALWAVLGGGKFLWRVLPTLLGAVAYLWCFESADGEWLGTTFVELGIWGAILMAGRLTGLELARPADSTGISRPFQFSIRDMLAWTTALAVLLSTLRCLPINWEHCSLPSTVVIGLSLTLVGGASMFCTLGGGWRLARLLPVPSAVGVGAYVLAATLQNFSAWYFALLLGLMSAWLVASLLCLRYAGYRLVWRWRFAPRNMVATRIPSC